jgi:nucleoside-diphosphate-sugar epimerase
MAEAKTILLTGGTGFLGSNLLIKLLDSGFNLVVLKRATSNLSRVAMVYDRVTWYDIPENKIDEIFRAHEIDVIIHCATNYGRGDIDPSIVLEANMFLPLSLLELGRKNNVSCFINTDTILNKRINLYSLSKSQFLDWLKYYAEHMTCINIALEHFFGPHDDKTKFVSNIIDQLLNKSRRIELTPGEQKRDFIYIDDVVEAFMRILSRRDSLGKDFLHFEIGTGRLVSIRDFVTAVKKIVGSTDTILDFGALPYRNDEIMESQVDMRPIMALGWRPQFSLEEGLRRTVAVERMNR